MVGYYFYVSFHWLKILGAAPKNGKGCTKILKFQNLKNFIQDPLIFFTVGKPLWSCVEVHILTKIVAADLKKIGQSWGHPTPPPKRRRGIFQNFLPWGELYRMLPEWWRSAFPFSRNLGKRFPFRPPSGGTVNYRRGKLHQGIKLDSKFLH